MILRRGLRLLEQRLPALEQRLELVAARPVRGEEVDVAPVLGELRSRSATSPPASDLRPRPARAPSAASAAWPSGRGFSTLPARAFSASDSGTEFGARLLARRDVVGPAAVVARGSCRPRSRASARRPRRGARGRARRAAPSPGSLERRLERLAALQVEVVRRLVEDEEVRAGRDHDRQRQPPPLAAREHRDRLLVLLPAGEEEAAEQVLRLGPVQPGRRWTHSSTVPRSSSSISCCEKYAGTTPWPSARPRVGSRRRAASRAASSCRSRSARRARRARRARARTTTSVEQLLVPGRQRQPLDLDHRPAAARRLQELEAEPPACAA